MSKSSGNYTVEVIYQTALATIRTAKDLSLVSMHLKCLTLLTAENVHDQNKFEAKPGSLMDLSPLTRICCTLNQRIMKKAHFQTYSPAPGSLDRRSTALGCQNQRAHSSFRLLLQPHKPLVTFCGGRGRTRRRSSITARARADRGRSRTRGS